MGLEKVSEQGMANQQGFVEHRGPDFHPVGTLSSGIFRKGAPGLHLLRDLSLFQLLYYSQQAESHHCPTREISCLFVYRCCPVPGNRSVPCLSLLPCHFLRFQKCPEKERGGVRADFPRELRFTLGKRA